MTTPRRVPHSERSLVFSRVDALRVDAPPLGVAPAADNNVMKVTPDCLFMRTARGNIYGGRGGGSWWVTVLSVFAWTFFSVMEYFYYLNQVGDGSFHGQFLEHYVHSWPLTLLSPTAALLFSFWVFIPWRRQLPIIFNRKTGTVTCAIGNEIVRCRWHDTEAYIKDVSSFSANAEPINEGVLNLIFVNVEGTRLRTSIAATKDDDTAYMSRGIYGAAMVWEYIRLYMKNGAKALPPNCAISKYRFDYLSECFTTINPFKVFKVKKRRNLIWSVLFFPIVLPLGIVGMLGDLLYFAFDRILPRRKWPQALIDACNGVWDGKEN